MNGRLMILATATVAALAVVVGVRVVDSSAYAKLLIGEWVCAPAAAEDNSDYAFKLSFRPDGSLLHVSDMGRTTERGGHIRVRIESTDRWKVSGSNLVMTRGEMRITDVLADGRRHEGLKRALSASPDIVDQQVGKVSSMPIGALAENELAYDTGGGVIACKRPSA